MKRLLLLIITLFFVRNIAFSQERYLIVLDIQQFPQLKDQPEGAVKELIQNVNSIIGLFDSENIIYIKAAGKELSIGSNGISAVILPAPDLDSTLNIVSKNIFLKTEGDAFTSTELSGFLEGKKVKEIILVGLMAEKCIYNTALGGQSRGYDIIIVPEGIIGTSPAKKDKAIKKLKAKGIKFSSLNEVVNTPE
jgi:nicotinamidase-related amidase